MQQYSCFAIIYLSNAGEEQIYFCSSSEERESYINFLVNSNSWNIIGCADVVPLEFYELYEDYMFSQEIDSWE